MNLPRFTLILIVSIAFGVALVDASFRFKRRVPDPYGIDGLTKVITSHYYRRPARADIPTYGYMAPPPYDPIPYYHTVPYTSGDSYRARAFIPRDAFY